MKKILIWERDDTNSIHAEGNTKEEAKMNWANTMIDDGDWGIGTIDDWKRDLKEHGFSEEDIKFFMEENGMV